MSTMWLEDLDTEAAEYDDGDDYDVGDVYDDSEDLDWDGEGLGEEGEDAETRATRRRRARARRVALARRRQAQVRRSRAGTRAVARPRGAPATRRAPSTAAAIQRVDLESKVAEDSLRQQIAVQRKRMSRSEYAAVAGLAVNQFMESFDQPENAYARAALRFAPLLLLAPQRRGRGAEAFAYDPRVIGGAAVLGITLLGEQRGKASIEVASTPDVAKNGSVQFVAQVLSTRGEVLAGRSIRWETSDPNVATVDPVTGKVTGVNAGAVFIIAKVEGLPAKRIPLVVRDTTAGKQA